MKRILLALAILALALPATRQAQAGVDVSIDFFYDNLSADDGNWIDVEGYGYCFQPNVAASDADWRPYADGYWAYTDAGWTWVSYEDFGWATYHYGRWSNLAEYGWVWVPGYDWAPAWVSWRTGGDYVGWAPLPPSVERVYEGRAITGGVDIEFDIGPLYYNFCDVRYIGEPVLRGRIFASSRNVTIINQTVNVTNITYSNSTVYNHGPDYDRLNRYSTRPIQRLALQRETAVGANFGAPGGRRANLNRVNGNQLMVVAPKLQKSEQPIAPKIVKTRVHQPKVEHGWKGIANRQQLQAEMTKENARNVRPPSFQPHKEREAAALTSVPENTGNKDTLPANGRKPDSKLGLPGTTAGAPAEDNPPIQAIAPRGRGVKERTFKPENVKPDPRFQENPVVEKPIRLQQAPARAKLPPPAPVAGEGENEFGRGNRQQLNIQPPPRPAFQNAPKQFEQAAPRKQIAPQQVIPQQGPSNVPAQDGRERKGKGNKKGDEQPNSPDE
jgi:hypothetical protein